MMSVSPTRSSGEAPRIPQSASHKPDPLTFMPVTSSKDFISSCSLSIPHCTACTPCRSWFPQSLEMREDVTRFSPSAHFQSCLLVSWPFLRVARGDRPSAPLLLSGWPLAVLWHLHSRNNSTITQVFVGGIDLVRGEVKQRFLRDFRLRSEQPGNPSELALEITKQPLTYCTGQRLILPCWKKLLHCLYLLWWCTGLFSTVTQHLWSWGCGWPRSSKQQNGCTCTSHRDNRSRFPAIVPMGCWWLQSHQCKPVKRKRNTF